MRATIKMKMAVTFAVILIMLTGIVGFSVMKLETLNDSMSNMVDDPATSLDRIQQFNDAITSTVVAQKNLALSDDAQFMSGQMAEIKQQRARADRLIAQALETKDPIDRAMYDDARRGWEEYKAIADEAITLAMQNRNAEASVISLGKGNQLAVKVGDMVDKIVLRQRNELSDADHAGDALYAQSRTTLFIVAAVAFLVAVAGAVWISHIVSQGLKRVSTAIGAVATWITRSKSAAMMKSATWSWWSTR